MGERHPRGFTIIELAIVLAILGILAALSLFTLAYRRDQAADSVCDQTMSQIKKAAELMFTDSGVVPDENLSNLLDAGYLKKAPSNPHGGTYSLSWDADGESATISCTIGGNVIHYPPGH